MDMSDDEGDELDDGALFASLYSGLRRFAAVVGWPDHDPDDLVQEAVARALRRGPLSSRSDPGAYLRTTIVRLASNNRRSRRTRERSDRLLRAGQPSGSRDDYPSDVDDLLAVAPRDRALLVLVIIDGAPYDLAARQLGISEVAARKRLQRALAQLRRDATQQQVDHA